MARQDDIEALLAQIAPLFLEIAEDAQEASAEFGATEWARKYLTRTAAVNQVSGTARWRMVGDGIVIRQTELPAGVELSTSDGEQNQGRYYLRAPELAVLLTIRRKPHGPDEQPAFLQLQLEGVSDVAPVDYGDEIVIYLAVPPLGSDPRFEVATRGKETIRYRLRDLTPVDEEGNGSDVTNLGADDTPPGPSVGSTRDEDVEEDDDDRGEDSATPPG